MSRTGGSGTGKWNRRKWNQRECMTGGNARAEGVCRWRKGRVAGGRSGVGHGNVLSLWWT